MTKPTFTPLRTEPFKPMQPKVKPGALPPRVKPKQRMPVRRRR